MLHVDIVNPYNAPVYHEGCVSSTMDFIRDLAGRGNPHGTVIWADFQESGRGRLGRLWKTEKGQALMFSIFLKFSDFSLVPIALTLRTGLAVSLAIEDFLPALTGYVQVKWPNDVMLISKNKKTAKKAVGILAEAENANVYLGIGVNITQRKFPKELEVKAGSLILTFLELFPDSDLPAILLAPDAAHKLLEKILFRLYRELEEPKEQCSWKTRLEERLYMRAKKVNFAVGKADSANLIQGHLAGIGEGGELLLIPQGETEPRAFITGELLVYNGS